VFKSLAGQAPEYLSDDCRLISGSLRSADTRTCIAPRTYNHFGDRSFSVSGSHLWNTLPKDLRQADINYEHFKRQPKTFLFRDHGALRLFYICASLILLLTYLLTLFSGSSEM